MAIDINEQKLYSCYLVPGVDDRYHDGVFQMEHDSDTDVLNISFRTKRANVRYNRVILDEFSERTTMALYGDALKYFIVAWKIRNTVLGLEQEVFYDSWSDDEDHQGDDGSTMNWSIDVSSLEDGEKLKILVIAPLPYLKAFFYVRGDIVIDYDKSLKSRGNFTPLTRYMFKSVDDHLSTEQSVPDDTSFNHIGHKITPYDLYSEGSSTSISEWFYYEKGSQDANVAFDPEQVRNIFQRISCREWRVYLKYIFNFTDSLTVRIWRIGDDQSGIITRKINTSNLKDGYYNFTLDQDGIYYINITDSTGAGVVDDYIFEYCGIEQCYLNLIEMIYCNDLDCCNNCSQEQKDQLEFRRNELMKLRSFMDIITFTINYLRVNSIGVIGQALNETTLELVNKMNSYYTRIEEIVARCGSCSDNLNSSSGCSQCS